MKYIDIRWGWVQQMRDRKVVKLIKVDGKKNLADGFSKPQERIDYQARTPRLMGKVPH